MISNHKLYIDRIKQKNHRIIGGFIILKLLIRILPASHRQYFLIRSVA